MCKEQIEKRCNLCKLIMVICTGVAIGLLVGSFFAPPTGEINASVLKAVGEVFAFSALWLGVRAIELGYDLKVAKGDASVELNNDK